MFQIRQTDVYSAWFSGLRDRLGRARIDIRIDHGPGYRVYFMQHGELVILLLAGGNKSTQDKDIRKAKDLANDFQE
jgi:putative component of toxin-antitoxin plasmid stabilization module